MKTVFELVLNETDFLGYVETEWLDELKITMYDVSRQVWGLNSPIGLVPTKGEVPFFAVNMATNERITARVIQ